MTDVVATAAEAAAQARPPLIVLEPLTAFLDAHRLGSGPLRAAPLGDGHSNVTYAIARDDVELVVRRPPRPPLPPSAHDVVREARLLSALAPAGVRVPRVLAVCEDASVLGMPFYVMERLHGDVVGPSLPDAFARPDVRRRMGEQLVDALAELHAVDVDGAGLAGFGRPAGYLERQLRRFGEIWAARRTRQLPDMDRVQAWLVAHVPRSVDRTVVHGDYRIGNVMYARGGKLLAVLDWEMATLGDPLADVGYLCATWAEPGDEDHPLLELSAATREPGFPTRDDVRARYARTTGRDLGELRWYETLALWKAAVFLESSYRRWCEGTTDDAFFGRLDEGVPRLARAALACAGG